MIHAFLKSVSPKVNLIVKYVTGTSPPPPKKKIGPKEAVTVINKDDHTILL